MIKAVISDIQQASEDYHCSRAHTGVWHWGYSTSDSLGETGGLVWEGDWTPLLQGTEGSLGRWANMKFNEGSLAPPPQK